MLIYNPYPTDIPTPYHKAFAAGVEVTVPNQVFAGCWGVILTLSVVMASVEASQFFFGSL